MIEKLFEKTNTDVFQNLQLAYEALKAGGSYSILLNAANEVLVELFLKKQIQFLDIQNHLQQMMASHLPVFDLEIDGIIGLDGEIRKKVLEQCL